MLATANGTVNRSVMVVRLEELIKIINITTAE